jgi:hypothetical protein
MGKVAEEGSVAGHLAVHAKYSHAQALAVVLHAVLHSAHTSGFCACEEVSRSIGSVATQAHSISEHLLTGMVFCFPLFVAISLNVGVGLSCVSSGP